MFELFLMVIALYIVHSWLSSVRKTLMERIEELDNQVFFLNDQVSKLKKQLKEKPPALSSEPAKADPIKTVASEATGSSSSSDSAFELPAEIIEKKLQTKGKTSDEEDSGLSFSSSGEDAVKNDKLDKSSDEKTAKETEKLPDKEPEFSRDGKKYEWLKSAKTDSSTDDKKARTYEKEKPSDDEKTSTAEKDLPGTSGSGNVPPSDPPTYEIWEKWEEFKNNIDWELFTGAKLFAWLGGLALFIGAGFFVKYSIDNNLISPILRLVIGAVVGLVMIGASFRFDRVRYDIMRQTFAAGGIGVLYSVFFAATLYYGYLAKPAGFACLVVISAASFVLALFHRGLAISVLGATGAYLTPLLVSTGTGSLAGLFAYLAIVNAGLYQVMRRLDSKLLFGFSAFGTMASLFLATIFANPSPSGLMIAIAWTGNLLVFAVILDLMSWKVEIDKVFKFCGFAVFLSIPIMAAYTAVFKSGSSPMAMLAVTVLVSLVLSYRNKQWVNHHTPLSVLTFMVAGLWAFLRFNSSSTIWSYLAFFVYGLAGSGGPLLLVKRYGATEEMKKWFKVFPVAVSLLMLMTIILSPGISPLFWPMAIGLQLIAIVISVIIGSLLQLAITAGIMVIAAIFWMENARSLLVAGGLYATILVGGALAIFVMFFCLKKVADWNLRLGASSVEKDGAGVPMSEWLSASPVFGVFALLATAFMLLHPLDPAPGMATLLCFGAIALTMARRMNYPVMIAITLFSAAAAQSVWALRGDLDFGLYFQSMQWSAGFFVAALVVPFFVYKSFVVFKTAWMAWPVFELIQGIFLVYAADHFWGRSVAGWLPLAMAAIRLPIVAHLLKKLEKTAERNSIIACQGGVLLFYLSSSPILLLEKGWIGLVLVLESVALLWLNRRIEHRGLRRVSVIMAPVGLFLLLSFLPQMKGPSSIVIFNSAVMSVLGAAMALFAGVRLSPYPDDRTFGFNISRYFQWLALGTGFYLVNLVVADVFAGSLVATGPTLKFIPGGNLLQSIAYTSLWALFGAMLWRSKALHVAFRFVGLILVIISSVWLLLFPVFHGAAVAAMSPFANLGLLAFAPIMLILLFLFLKEPWGETSVSFKNLFLGLLLLTGFIGLKVVKSSIFQTGQPLDIFIDKTANMAVASAAGWIIYGLLLMVWPRRLDRPFRLAGLTLLSLGMLRTLAFPFRYSVEFGAMQPLFNRPTALFVFVTILLIWLTKRKYDEAWPLKSVQPNALFAISLAVLAFAFMNFEIASYFGQSGRPFSLLTRGSLSHQLGYSLGWLAYAIGLLACGIKWRQVRARQAALILVLITCFKIFLKDLWSLGQLYRVASFIGLAVVLMLVSYLYQRFLSNSGDRKNEN